jgi:hypothetical protein
MERIRRGQRVEHYETIRQRKHGSLIDVSLSISRSGRNLSRHNRAQTERGANRGERGTLPPKGADDGVVFWRIEAGQAGHRMKGHLAEARRSIDFIKINANK